MVLPAIPPLPQFPALPLPPPLPNPCLALPIPPLPVLPNPFTLGLAVPTFNFDPVLCCKILPFPLVTPPIPLPPGVLNVAAITAINEAVAAVIAYLDQFQFSCPLE